jgi:hypothetical protein
MSENKNKTCGIIWLEDPKQWKYLRVSQIMRGSRVRFKNGSSLKNRIGDFYKLVGYKVESTLESRCFLCTIYWLKNYDSGCPLGHEGYDKDGRRPCEGKLVKDLLGVET